MITFNHHTDSLAGAMGITDKRALEISAIILYEKVHVQMLVEDLYDDEDSIPREIASKSSLLEKVLANFTEEHELIFAGIEFGKFETIKVMSEEIGLQMTMMSLMMYHKGNKDKQKFIKAFVQHSLEAIENNKSGSLSSDSDY